MWQHATQISSGITATRVFFVSPARSWERLAIYAKVRQVSQYY